MNLDYLITYLELIKLGSFSTVAKKLSISQPAVSFQIQRLEHDLGVRLINRSRKRITMTDAGKRLLKFATTVEEERNRLLNDLDRLRHEVLERLVLSPAPSPVNFCCPPL